MGIIEQGAPYSSSGIRFELELDWATPEYRQKLVTDTILRPITPLPERLIPKSFIAWTDGSKKASVVFGEDLNDEDLRRAVRILLARLVELGCLRTMPALPDPLYVRR